MTAISNTVSVSYCTILILVISISISSSSSISIGISNTSSRNIIEMGGACSSDREGRGVYRVLVEKTEGKRPLGRSKCRWEDNIKLDLQEVGYGGMD
jgi:hypothetical protein